MPKSKIGAGLLRNVALTIRSWVLLALTLPGFGAGQQVADAIYINGDVVTGEGIAGPQAERVSALAIVDGRIAAAGQDQEVLKHAGPRTTVVNLRGAFAMPGFNDAHLHLADAGSAKLQVDLIGSASLDEMLTRIGVAATHARPRSWLQGFGWDHTLWANKELPSRRDLDRVTGGHPAIFQRIDGHIAVANSMALHAGGVTKDTPDPLGGGIDHDSAGEPTGILRDTAMEQLGARIPPPSRAERRRALELALADAVSHGLTSAQDYSEWDDFLVYERMEREGKLPLRISEWLTFNDPLGTLIKQRASHSANDPMLHTGMLKGFMDGSLGSRTAALYDPYTDDPGNSGLPRYEQAKLDQMTVERAKAGFQIGFHAIGDRAVGMALNGFAAARAAGATEPRFRVEHAQVLVPADFARFAELHVIASMQPNHLLTDMRWAEARLGSERARYSYAWRSMLDHHVVLALGTDYPVEPVQPFRGLYAAITRRSEDGTHTYVEEERLTIGEALYAYTQGAAYAENMENSKGKLAPGYLADFVVLDQDLLQSTPAEVLQTRVLRTVVGGRTVYQSRTASTRNH